MTLLEQRKAAHETPLRSGNMLAFPADVIRVWMAEEDFEAKQPCLELRKANISGYISSECE